jgi:hypothetical protein
MNILISASIFLISEILFFFLVFRALAKWTMGNEVKSKVATGSIDFTKGVLERLVIAIALSYDLQQILTFFGAMKLGTRLKSKSEEPAFNNFYLMGNLISVLLAIFYFKFLDPSGTLITQVRDLILYYFG